MLAIVTAPETLIACPRGQVSSTLQQLNPITGGPMPGLFPGRCGRFIGLWNTNGICTWAQGVQDCTFPNNSLFIARLLINCMAAQAYTVYQDAIVTHPTAWFVVVPHGRVYYRYKCPSHLSLSVQ